jgi:gliding motility-associated-like protein
VLSTDANGCTDLTTVTVFVEIPCNLNLLDAILPNAFSPNGDQENDLLCGQSSTCIKTFSVFIYNRWGEKVFESSSLNDCWDGTYRGQKLNTGVFAFLFEARLTNGDTFRKKGNVTLVR